MAKYIHILGHPFPKIRVLITVTLISIFLGASIAALFFILLKKNEFTESNKTSQDEFSEVFEKKISEPAEVFDPNSISDVIRAHIEVTGFRELRNFTMKGTPWDDNGLSRSASLQALAPNYYRFTLEYLDSKHTVNFGYDGESVWMGKSWPGEVGPNEVTDRMIVLMLASHVHLAWSYNSDKREIEGINSVLELMPSQKREGRLYYVVRSKGLLPFEMEHYIDSVTFYETSRTATFTGLDGASFDAEVEYSTESISEDFHLPSQVDYFENGKLTDQINYSSSKSNIMLMKIIFSEPNTN